jgi:hypothetical protein
MLNVLKDPNDATARWLTDALRAHGALRRGHVVDVHRGAAQSTSTWQLHSLELRYSPDAAAAPEADDLPKRLLLKVSHDAPHHGLNTGKEVWFYRHVATEESMRSVPLVRCYAAGHEPPYGASHALVDDLSATHGQPPLLLLPTHAHCVHAIEVLAQLHAAWWQHPRLASGHDVAKRLAWEREAAQAIGRLEPIETLVPTFLAYLGDRLASNERDVFERFLASDARRRERRQRRPQTMRHGDAHWWNFLYPNDPTVGTTQVLDWGSWRTGVGTDDLAYLIALHAGRAWRSRFEEDLLRRYHGALTAAGVSGYDWSACWDDYRWSVIDSLLIAPHFWSINVPASIWWPKVECGLAAFEDLHCADLLA